MKHYEFVFAGAGLSGLMTAWQMARGGHFENCRALLVDRDAKTENDRTWCFWEKGDGAVDDIVSVSWGRVLFRGHNFSRLCELRPYRYKKIRGEDFYRMVRGTLSAFPNVEWLQADVVSVSDLGEKAIVNTSKGNFSAGKVLDSRTDLSEAKQSRFPLLLQHFIGWTVETDADVFDQKAATFMDFSIPQKGRTRFMYVLPESPRKALVEYTLFSEKPLPEIEYETAIEDYLKTIGAINHNIVEKERGAIPMSVFPFWKSNSKNVLRIGSAGGWTKASTGFTFRNAMKRSVELSSFLKSGSDLRTFQSTSRFRFYDRLLLDILHRHNDKGAAVFTSMFKNSDPKLVLKFLDEETTFAEDLRIIWSCPKGLFMAAFCRWVFGAA